MPASPNPAAARTKRAWGNTHRKLDIIVAKTGLSRIRQFDACVRGWLMLEPTDPRREHAMNASDREPTTGASLNLWPATFDAVDQIVASFPMSPDSVKVIDVIVEAWSLLTADERARAIELAAADEPAEAA